MPAISKIPQKKRTPTRRSEPKLFRCTGFGHCDMVFTRSEHLARHARKHTGEVIRINAFIHHKKLIDLVETF
jgi:uncharacterized Zn-finger protein